MTEETNPAPEKRGPGRPRKPLAAKPEAPVTPARHKMKAKPNWDSFDATDEATPDRLRIPESLIPAGMKLQWVTDSVLGQQMASHRASFERTGWTPVHQEDFDGQFNGMFMPKNAPGEINLEGLVLMARPQELSDRAERLDKMRAREQLEIKERQFRSGDLPGVTLDAQAKSAVESNRISRSFERITVPGDK